MLSVDVQFAQCYVFIGDPKLDNFVSVNHAMFYVSDLENNTVHRVHSYPKPNGEYAVESTPQKHNVPRKPVGEGFEVELMPSVDNMNGKEFAEMLATLPPPKFGEGACQWWVLQNLVQMQNNGQVRARTVFELLSDTRMDSTRLMEFQELRDELQQNALQSNSLQKTASVVVIEEVTEDEDLLADFHRLSLTNNIVTQKSDIQKKSDAANSRFQEVDDEATLSY